MRRLGLGLRWLVDSVTRCCTGLRPWLQRSKRPATTLSHFLHSVAWDGPYLVNEDRSLRWVPAADRLLGMPLQKTAGKHASRVTHWRYTS